MLEPSRFVKVNRSKALIGPDHQKADLLAKVFGAALCTTSSEERKKTDEDESSKKATMEK